MKKLKIIICILVILLIVALLNEISFATTTEGLFSDESLKGVNEPITDFGNNGIGGGINTIIGLLQVAGTGISIITVTMLGIKYILASVEEKAEIKKQAVPIVIGCVLLFGAVQIMALVESFASKKINVS